MADWVPVYRKVFTDPRMAALAARLGASRDQAVIYCIHLWHAVADQSPAKGEIGQVDDATIEVWAEWRGRKGRFAVAYRELFQVDGCIRKWKTYVGDALEASEREKERKRTWWREHRGKNGNLDADSPSSGGASKRASKRASGGVQDKTDMTIPPKSPADAVAASAGTAGGPAAGDGEPPTPEQREANARRLREAVIAAGVLPVASVPVVDTPEALAELQARKDAAKRQLAERTAKPAEAAHG